MKTYLEIEDVQLMEGAATCLRDRLLIQLLFRLGCRVSELLAIKVSDINFTDGKITVLHLKTRIRLLCPGCKARLARRHQWVKKNKSLLIPQFPLAEPACLFPRQS